MHIILSWLRLGDGSPVHGFQSSSLSIKNAGTPVLANPFKSA